ncbi:MAG: YrvL family regulatory protein [Bacillota bacterium]
MNNEEPDEPFKDLPFSSKLLVIASLFLIIAAAIGVIAGGYFFGIKGLFSILGVTYESDKTLLFFIFGCFGAGLIIEPFIKLFSMFVYHLTAMKKTAITRLVFYFIGNVITISIVDFFMDSIYIPDSLITVISAVMAFAELAFDDKPDQ